LVEYLPSKQVVAGSSPVSRSGTTPSKNDFQPGPGNCDQPDLAVRRRVRLDPLKDHGQGFRNGILPFAMPHQNRIPKAQDWWRGPIAPLLAIAALKLCFQLALNGNYGLHTDEFYYILSGQHLSPGYVDFPPVTPLLARLDTSIFGISAWTLRLVTALTGAVMIFLTGLCARELGASRRIAAFAAVLAFASPYLLATWLFQTVEFDMVLWLLAIYLLLRIMRLGDWRLFILLGLDIGVGLETKWTIVALCAGIVVAVVISADLRPSLRTRYPWIGLAIAAACAAPNVAWQALNGFPTLAYISNHGSDIAHSGGAAAFVELFVLIIGPLLLPLWIAGMAFLWRDRMLGPTAVLVAVTILLFLVEGKAYYPAPTVPFVLAAGCVAVGRIGSQARRSWVVGLAVAAGIGEAAILSPLILPVVPPASMHRLGIDTMNPDFANTFGWQDMVSQVGAVYNALPSDQRIHSAILAAIDGQAGAIDIYGGAEHLPQAISPHLSFWYWKPAGLDPTTLVTVGYRPSDLAFLCRSVRQAATVRIPYSIENLNQGAPILVCTNLRESLGAAWPALRNFG
jgi:dolichyl-phosphate-mannose-protein mannosyltransferase